jgi:hypothetical protein
VPYPTYETHAAAPDRKAQHYQEVQLRAYHLWESAGRPEGMMTAVESWQDHFWKSAERLVMSEELWDAALNCASTPC